MITSLFAFVISVLAIVSLFFILSYLVWADRNHTPEVVAAEASLFFQKVETAFPVLLAIAIVGALILTQIRWQ